MHELSVTQSILEICIHHAETAHAKRISDIYLVIGQLSSVLDDSVQFYWDILSKDTIAENSLLHFERIPARLKCQECDISFELIAGATMPCPQCKSIRITVIKGNEFHIESIEIE